MRNKKRFHYSAVDKYSNDNAKVEYALDDEELESMKELDKLDYNNIDKLMDRRKDDEGN